MKIYKGKYKIKDKVRTSKRLKHLHFYNGLIYLNNMKSDTLTIKRCIVYGKLIYYDVFENKYRYSEKMLRRKEDEKTKQKNNKLYGK